MQHGEMGENRRVVKFPTALSPDQFQALIRNTDRFHQAIKDHADAQEQVEGKEKNAAEAKNGDKPKPQLAGEAKEGDKEQSEEVYVEIPLEREGRPDFVFRTKTNLVFTPPPPKEKKDENYEEALKWFREQARLAFQKLGPLKYIIWGTLIILADVACTPFFMGSAIPGLEIIRNVLKGIPREKLIAIIKEILEEKIGELFKNHPEEAALLAFPGFCNLVADLTTLTVTGEMSDVMNGKLGGGLTGLKKFFHGFSFICGLIHYDTLASPDGAMLYQAIAGATGFDNPIFAGIFSQVVTLALGVPYYIAADDPNCILTANTAADEIAYLRQKTCCELIKKLKYFPEFVESFKGAASVLTYRLGLNYYSNNSYFKNVFNMDSDHPTVRALGYLSTAAAFVRISSTRLVKPVKQIMQFDSSIFDVCSLRTYMQEVNKQVEEKLAAQAKQPAEPNNEGAEEKEKPEEKLLAQPKDNKKINKIEFPHAKHIGQILVNLIQSACFKVFTEDRWSPLASWGTTTALFINTLVVTYKTELCKAIAKYEDEEKIPKEQSKVFQVEFAIKKAEEAIAKLKKDDAAIEAVLGLNQQILTEVMKDYKQGGADVLGYVLLIISRFGLRLIAQPSNAYVMADAFRWNWSPRDAMAAGIWFGIPNAYNEITNFSPLVGNTFAELGARRALAKVDPGLFPRGLCCTSVMNWYFTFIEECDPERLQAAQKKLMEMKAENAVGAKSVSDPKGAPSKSPTEVEDVETRVGVKWRVAGPLHRAVEIQEPNLGEKLLNDQKVAAAGHGQGPKCVVM